MIKGIMISVRITIMCSLWFDPVGGQTNGTLNFPKDNFTVETKKVRTSTGEKIVIYHSYMHIPYVANPVDKDYQSMNVSVPVRIDDKAIDAKNAPILFVIGVGGYNSVNNASSVSGNFRGNADLALAAGYVIVSPGCRGRDNKGADGTFYGKAPAAIVDLKAAVRYIRHNKGVMPGNVNWIFSTGVSAGGALSALLGSSGNSPLYNSYLKEIGAADTKDNIFGSACFCPITDLEHSDGAYEWMYGTFPTKSGLVDRELSNQLKAIYAGYLTSLNLKGKNSFGTITADNYDRYLLQYFLVVSANKFLNNLSDEKRNEYLARNKWITWTDKGASFTFQDFVAHVGRMKGLPAFDDFAMRQPEPSLFGNKTTEARHYTDFSLQQTSGNKSDKIDNEVKSQVNMMNAMYFIGQNKSDCVQHWWLRQGSSDNHTSQTVIANLATSLENRNKDVNTLFYWDAGHGADQDAEEFIAWIGTITGYRKNN
jgi:hypothetical protein